MKLQWQYLKEGTLPFPSMDFPKTFLMGTSANTLDCNSSIALRNSGRRLVQGILSICCNAKQRKRKKNNIDFNQFLSFDHSWNDFESNSYIFHHWLDEQESHNLLLQRVVLISFEFRFCQFVVDQDFIKKKTFMMLMFLASSKWKNNKKDWVRVECTFLGAHFLSTDELWFLCLLFHLQEREKNPWVPTEMKENMKPIQWDRFFLFLKESIQSSKSVKSKTHSSRQRIDLQCEHEH